MSKDKKHTRFAIWLMKRFIRDTDSDYAIGDLEEMYCYIAEKNGKVRADFWLCFEVLRSLPGFVVNSICWRIIMLKNYVLIALRNLRKNKAYSLINITGFAVGLAAAILTFLFVLDEIRVNKHYADLDQIYWVRVRAHLGGEVEYWWGTPSAVGTYLKNNYPDIIESGVMVNGQSSYLLKSDSKRFIETVKLGEFSLFNVFSHEVLKGTIPANDDIHSMVIDDEIAEKFFGNENPIGKTLQLDGTYDLEVAAVFKRMTNNATDRFKILVPFKLIDELWGEGNAQSWGNHAFRVFVKARENLDIEAFNRTIDNIIIEHNPNSNSHPYLYPFKDKYLVEHHAIENVRTYSIITILLLLVASINYINLSSAQSIKRAREVGIRKVVGAKKNQIISQFFFESLIITILAVAVAAFILIIVYPFWQEFNSMTIPLLGILADFQIFTGVFAIILLTAILSSVYPAFILSSFLPKKVLQGDLKSGRKGKALRSVLVMVQFAVAIALVIITTTVYKQIQFMKNKNLGFKTDQIAYFFLQGNLESKARLLKTEINNIPGVLNVSLSSHIPGSGDYWNTSAFTWQGKPEDLMPLVSEHSFDEHYLETYDIKLVEGRQSTQSIQPRKQVLINETLAKMINKENVLGQAIWHKYASRSYQIIGVIQDFHHETVKNKITPFIFYTDEERMHFHYLAFRFEPERIQEVLKSAEKIVTSIESDYPFAYTFLDQDFAEWYEREERVLFTVQLFGFIAIFVSCLGLFGMATFATNQRIKEIGIRKTLGASSREIVMLLLREFTKWVCIANIFGWPVAYLYLRNWINEFPYRISLGPEIFLVSGVAALVLAVITVMGRAYRAAIMNPVNSLRVE